MKYKMLIISIFISLNLYSQNPYKYVRVKEVKPYEYSSNVVKVVVVDDPYKADLIVKKSASSFEDYKAIKIKEVKPYSYEGRNALKIYIKK